MIFFLMERYWWVKYFKPKKYNQNEKEKGKKNVDEIFNFLSMLLYKHKKSLNFAGFKYITFYLIQTFINWSDVHVVGDFK